MRGTRPILALTALFLTGSASIAFSQEGQTRELRKNRSLDRMKAFRQNTNFDSGTERTPPRLGTFQASRFRGMRTRSEQLDELLRSFRPETRERDLSRLDNPIREILEKRNLLAPRSALAAKSVSNHGRNLIIPPAAPKSSWASVRTPTAASDSEIEDVLNDKKTRSPDEYFEKGLKYFREGDYIRAQNYFDIDADLNLKKARPYTAAALAAYRNGDFHQGYFKLLTAIGRAQTLDDLHVDVDAFFPDRQEFVRTMNEVNIWAKSFPDRAGPNMLLAYLSWLNGDRATALAAIEVGVQHPGNNEEGDMCQKFRDLLMSAPATTQP